MTSGEAWTIRRLLEWTGAFLARKGVDSPRLSAELLLAHVLKCARIRLYTDYNRVVTDEHLALYRDLVRRAAEHQPIAYLTGTAHFFNLEFEVTPDVLIPRPDTETLVENVIQSARLQGGLEAPRVLDLCTGCGCIAAAVACNLKAATVVATDISGAAVAVAKRNMQRLGLSDRVTVVQGDLYEALSQIPDAGQFNLILANPPYIPTDRIASLDRSVRDYEPLAALDGGRDGLMVHRRILADAPRHLSRGGKVYLEIGADQAEAAIALAEQSEGLVEPRILKDYGGNPRVLTVARK